MPYHKQLVTNKLLGVASQLPQKSDVARLGIDIGDLDLTLHVGVPPTVAWEHPGEVARDGACP